MTCGFHKRTFPVKRTWFAIAILEIRSLPATKHAKIMMGDTRTLLFEPIKTESMLSKFEQTLAFRTMFSLNEIKIDLATRKSMQKY